MCTCMKLMILRVTLNQILFIPRNVLLIICAQQYVHISTLTTSSIYTGHSPAGFEDKSSDSGTGQYNGRYNTAHQSHVYNTAHQSHVYNTAHQSHVYNTAHQSHVYNTDTSETYNSNYGNSVDGMAGRILKLYW
jgi:hypothetical protein